MNKKMVLSLSAVGIIIIGIVVVANFLIGSLDFPISKRAKRKKEAMNYLVEKYGDQGFKFQSFKCDVPYLWALNSSSYSYLCEGLVTANNLNGRSFRITCGYEGEPDFDDEYTAIKYHDKLINYYYDYLSVDLDPNIALTHLFGYGDYDDELSENISFDEYVNYWNMTYKDMEFEYKIKIDKKYNHLNVTWDDVNAEYPEQKIDDPNLKSVELKLMISRDQEVNDNYIKPAEQELDKYIIDNYDVDALKENIINAVNKNKSILHNVRSVKLVINGCDDDEHILCSKTFDIELPTKE